ncbi:MAG: tandem-95 repeat protein, partial [Candidatus Cloacimonetes bacterium]|nr:tandem-95 repeat protein [Candidatus Cloacimonadota bacterium]
SILNLSAPADWNGSEVIAVSVNDGQNRASSSDIVEIIVTAVNDAPVLTLPEQVSFLEDGDIILDIAEYSFDADDDVLSLAAESEELLLNWEELLLTISASSDWNGSGEVIITVSDNMGSSAIDTLQVEVTAVNDAPVIELPESFSFEEDGNLSIELLDWSWDVDEDILSFSAESMEIITELNGSLLNLSAPENWNGSEVIIVSVNDGQNRTSSSDQVEIIVETVNDAPVIELPPVFSFDEDSYLEIELSNYVDDIDNSTLSYFVASDSLICELYGSLLHITALPDWWGSESITVTVDDETGRLQAEAVTEITVNSINDAPWLELPELIEMESGESYVLDLSLYCGDIEGDTLTAVASSDVLTLEITALLLNISVNNWSGITEITVEISDGELTATDSISVIVSSEEVSLSYDLIANWNWISFNTLPEAADVSELLAPLEGNALQIKSQNASSTWWADWGWLGQLTELEAGRMYLLRMTEAYDNYVVTGNAADVQMPIPLTGDWNWIGHLPQESCQMTVVMEQLEPSALQIKSQNTSSTWWEGWGWLGQLTELESGVGYKLKMAEADTLIYPQGGRHGSLKTNKNNHYRWQTTSGFEMNMTLLAEINGDGIDNLGINECAFFDEAGICHGEGTYLVEVNAWYFTIGGNTQDEALQLMILLDSGEELIASEFLLFDDNAILGTPQSPVSFEIIMAGEDDNEIPLVTLLGQSYPNPARLGKARARLIIPYQVAGRGEIELVIYNYRGQKVKELIKSTQEPGYYEIDWDGRDDKGSKVSSGIYFYGLESTGKRICRKLLLFQ